MIPTAKLRVEFLAINPPKPIGAHVIVDDKTVAIVPIEELDKAMHDIATMRGATLKIG